MSYDADLAEIETRLRQLEVDDLALVTPPPDVWAGIEQELAAANREAAVVELAPRRSRAARWLLVAAAAVAVVAGVLIVTAHGTDEAIVSSAQLTYDPGAFDPLGADSSATAVLVRQGDHYEIRLTDTEFPALANDHLELWLIEPDAAGAPLDVAPVAVVDRAGSRSYRVPNNLDPASHYIVDISIEPRDGDAAHSGRSILRGALQPSA